MEINTHLFLALWGLQVSLSLFVLYCMKQMNKSYDSMQLLFRDTYKDMNNYRDKMAIEIERLTNTFDLLGKRISKLERKNNE
jgi:hypothetical protein